MTRAFAALLILQLGACATEAQEPPGYGEGLGTPENPIPNDDLSYVVTSQVGTSGSVSATAAAAVAQMRSFAAAPADTLLLLAQTASMPELAQLNAELPSTLSTRLRGWIDVEIDKAKVSTISVRQYASDVATFTETALSSFVLDSTLSFSPTLTSHSLRALRFRLAGLDVVVPIGGLKADVIAQKPTVSIAEAGAVTFGQQTFGLAFGSHAWHAINLASTQLHGTEVMTTFTRAVDCRLLAQAVAARCYNGACVGHQSQLITVCQKSMQLLVTDLSSDVAEQGVDELVVLSGVGRLIDKNIDGLADNIEGAWTLDAAAGGSSVKFTAEAIR